MEKKKDLFAYLSQYKQEIANDFTTIIPGIPNFEHGGINKYL